MLKRLINRTVKLVERLSGSRVKIQVRRNRVRSNPQRLKALMRELAPVPVKTPMIRLGSEEDGGYLLPDDFGGISAVISPGVSTEISFDLAMAERGKDVFMLDASVEGPPLDRPEFHFRKKFLNTVEDSDNIRLATLCDKIKPVKDDLLLQMDIEGAEYLVLLDADDRILSRFRIMVIEFHRLDQMFEPERFELMQAVFRKLLRTHHVVHIHPNNCAPAIVLEDFAVPPVMEFTFYRKDRADVVANRALTFPHPLDRDNFPENPSVPLPECWR